MLTIQFDHHHKAAVKPKYTGKDSGKPRRHHSSSLCAFVIIVGAVGFVLPTNPQ